MGRKQNKVFVTQIPGRRENDAWVPSIDISPAKEFGDLEIIFPVGYNFPSLEIALPKLRERLSTFLPGDYLLALGDPTLMMAASALLGRQLNQFEILKLDRRLQRYFSQVIPSI